MVKVAKNCIAGLFALGMLMSGPSARAAVIDQGTITLDQVTGYQWLDLTYTTGMSYDAALAGVANTVEGGGWVVATYDEVLAFWTSITGIASWPLETWDTSLSGAGTAVGGLVGYTYDIIQYDGSNTKQVIGWHSGAIDVDEYLTEAVGLITNETWNPGQGYVYDYGPGYKYSSNVNIGVWLVRGDNIRPKTTSGDIGSEEVPAPAPLGLIGFGLAAMFGGASTRRRA